MLMAPIKQAPGSISVRKTVPAPMLGLNTAQPITATGEGHCLRLDNWVCRTDGVRVRSGFEVVTSGIGAPVTSLASRGGTIVAGTASGLYVGGSLGASSLGNGDWHTAELSNPGGLWLVATNGTTGGYKVWNGSAWSSPTLTGVDSSKIVSVLVHHNRVWLVERDSLTLWYLPLFAFAGTVKPAYLTPLCRKGGSVTAIASMTQDGGRNSNDALVAITSEGEVVIWSGSDPDSSASWALSGVYTTAKPIGRRCLTPHEGSLAYLSEIGLLRIPEALQRPDEKKREGSLSDNIWPTLIPELSTGSWCLASSIENEILVVSGPSRQFVLSSTGGWSTFSGLSATSWASISGDLYFGTSAGTVCRYGGLLDGVQPISSFLVDRYVRHGGGRRMIGQRVRPLYKAAHPYRPRLKLYTNDNDPPDTFPAHWTDDPNWMWEDITWQRQPMLWNRPTSSRVGRWRGINGDGVSHALAIGMKTRTAITYMGAELMLESGGDL